MIPDTNVGGKIATISEVSDDQKTTGAQCNQIPDYRDRGEPIGSAPPTPPGMRVRTGRFEKLRFHESLGTPNRSK
jgi:hypothetical protein